MKFLAGLFAFAVVISALSVPALASGVNLEIRDRATGNVYDPNINPLETCPGPLTVKEVSVKVTNVGTSTDTYKLSLKDMQAGWTGQIQPDVMLASGESKILDLFVVNTYFTEPGTYSFKIRAESMTNPADVKESIVFVKILPCYTLELKADSEYKETCFESGGEVKYAVSIKNTGKFKETFTLSSSSGRVSQSEVTLEPEQGSSFDVFAPVSSQGASSIIVTAKSKVSQASVSTNMTLNAKDCYSSTAAIEPQTASACISKAAQFKVTVTNTGSEADTFKLSSAGWVLLSQTSLNIAKGESKTIDAMVTPDKAGRLTAEITIASSEKDAKKVSAIIDASECRDIVVVTSPASSSVCKGEIAAYDITVKNRGAMDDTITLSSTSGSLNINKVVLAAGESKTVQLNVDTSSMEGAKKIEITATDGKVSDKSSVDLNVEACRLAELSIEPSNKTICPFTGFNYTITLANKGKFSDTFTMKFKDVTESATLAPGQSESWSIPVYAEESGAYSLTATAESNSTKAGAATVLVVQPVGKCYSVEIKSDKEARAEVLKANTVKLTIKNTGSVKDSYVLSVDGPSWAYVSPEVIELEPGISADAYLYISPARESDNSTTNVVVNVKSNNAAASSTISAIVGNGGQGGGLGSISFSNITGSIISESGDRPFWKVAVVVLITLAIIIILFVRFVLLVK